MRKHDWPERLQSTVDKYQRADFVYGKTDCWLFVTECVAAVCHNTLYTEALGDGYKSLKQSLKSMKKAYGVKRYIDLPDAFFIRTGIPTARRGDIVQRGKALGICMGRTSLFLNEDEGMVHVPTSQCQRAWRVE